MYLSPQERLVVQQQMERKSKARYYKAVFSKREGVLICLQPVAKPEQSNLHIKTGHLWLRAIKTSHLEDIRDAYATAPVCS